MLRGNQGANQETEAAKQRQEASRASLEAGGLPLNAVDRLQEQAGRQGKPGHIFTSDLSVNELALGHDRGYAPLGQVMGSSVYYVGIVQNTNYQQAVRARISNTTDMLTEAYHEVYRLAIGRLQQEAALLGATGVVGVRLHCEHWQSTTDLVEVSVIGTAIREVDLPAPDKSNLPFVSALSGQEFWMLRQAGHRPVGLLVGNRTCYSYGVPSANSDNFEAGAFTQSIYEARSVAMGQMEQEGIALGAVGILGADVETRVERVAELGGFLIHFTAVGTAIAAFQGRWPIFSVLNTISLKDKTMPEIRKRDAHEAIRPGRRK